MNALQVEMCHLFFVEVAPLLGRVMSASAGYRYAVVLRDVPAAEAAFERLVLAACDFAVAAHPWRFTGHTITEAMSGYPASVELADAALDLLAGPALSAADPSTVLRYERARRRLRDAALQLPPTLWKGWRDPTLEENVNG